MHFNINELYRLDKNILTHNQKTIKMKTSIYLLTLLISVYFFQSCSPSMNVRNSNKRAGITRVKQFTEKGTLLWAHYDPTQRQTLMFIDDKGAVKILAEQSPDAGLSRSLELNPKVKIEGKVDVEVLIKTEAELAKLTNRTTSLMITREALYRLSEAYFNGAVSAEKYIELYKEIIKQTENLITQEARLEEARSKTAESEAEKAKTEADLEKEKLKLSKENHEVIEDDKTSKKESDKKK